MKRMSRREFLRKTIVGGTLLTIPPMIYVPKAHALWAPKTPVHPNIDSLRVVGLTDGKMTRGQDINSAWQHQEKLVVKEVVWENMDKLACALSETTNPREGWQRIFVKPPTKSWSDTVVAIKTNHIYKQHTRSAVMSGVCRTLTNIIGVKPGNIHIYDGCHGRLGLSPFTDLPRGVRIEDAWGGYSGNASVPKPWKGGSTRCVKHFVNGTVDILINIAVCKGHADEVGGFTMTMKNHFGTFFPNPGHNDDGMDYLMAINQTPEILGPLDKRTGKVLFPRQQLCIVDALWASKEGPHTLPSAQPNFLAMGVFSPVFDYILATQFRRKKMGWPFHVENTRRFLSDFGYEESDLPSGGKLIEV
jgi:hypothetical protein